MEFKGTKDKLELKYVSGVCIGIGTVGDFSQMTANSILPDTDKEYENEKLEIESNMLLYSKAIELLENAQMRVDCLDLTNLEFYQKYGFNKAELIDRTRVLIKETTEIK